MFVQEQKVLSLSLLFYYFSHFLFYCQHIVSHVDVYYMNWLTNNDNAVAINVLITDTFEMYFQQYLPVALTVLYTVLTVIFW